MLHDSRHRLIQYCRHLHLLWNILSKDLESRDGLSLGVQGTYGRLFPLGIGLIRFGAALALILAAVQAHVWPESRTSPVGGLTVQAGAAVAYISFAVLSGRLPWFKGWERQITIDLVFASIVFLSTRDIKSSTFVFFAIPILVAVHGVEAQRFLGLIMTICSVAACAIVLSAVTGAYPVNLSTMTSITNKIIGVALVLTYRTASLMGLAVVLRLYNEARRGEMLIAERERRKANESKFRVEALHKGIKCGVCLLSVSDRDDEGDGQVIYWNETQEHVFAPPEGAMRKAARQPCYFVFHGQETPCTWCGLSWTKVPSQTNESSFSRYKIDTGDLLAKVATKHNWAISNQLRAGEEAAGESLFHIYQIHYGPMMDSSGKKVVAVVEAVTEVTNTILEMPFLLHNQHAVDAPLGALPLAILDSERHVIALNRAKEKRCEKPKHELVGKLCYQAFGYGEQSTFCEDCPVDRAISSHQTTVGMAHHPGHSMLTCIPIEGPGGELRAVFEFIHDMSREMMVMDALRCLNANSDPDVIVRQGLGNMKELANAFRCVLFTVDQPGRVFVRGDSSAQPDYHREYDLTAWPVLLPAIRERRLVRSADLAQEPGVPRAIRRLARKLHIGPVTFLPVPHQITEEGTATVVAIERKKGQTAVEEDALQYCRILAEGMAGARQRAIHEERAKKLAAQRRGFLDIIETIYDRLLPDIALSKLVKCVPGLIHADQVKMRISLYSVVEPEQGIPVEAKTVSDGVTLRLEADSFDPDCLENAQRSSKRRRMKVRGAFLSYLSSRDGSLVDLHRDSTNDDVADYFGQGTKSGMLIPFVYSNRIVGCLLAESQIENARTVFADDVSEMLRLTSVLAGLLVGRYRVIAEVVGHLSHQDVHVNAISDLCNEICQHIEGKELGSWRERLLKLLGDYRDDILSIRNACAIAIGQDIQLARTPVNLRELVSEVRSRFERLRRDVPEIKMSGPIDVTLSCNRRAMHSILFELLQNAVNHGVRGGEILLDVCVKKQKIHLKLSNNVDAAMPADVVDRLRDPLYRFHPVSPRGAEGTVSGTGLGLWQASVLLQAQEGSFAIEENQSHRVAFVITLMSHSVEESREQVGQKGAC